MSEALRLRAQQECLEVLGQKGWDQFRDISVQLTTEHPMSAALTLADRKILLWVNPELESKIDSAMSLKPMQYSGNLSWDPLSAWKSMIYFAVVHERAHDICCPKTDEGTRLITGGVFDAIQHKFYRKETLESQCKTISNEFADIIINTRNSLQDGKRDAYREGFDYFYLLMSEQLKAQKSNLGKRFTLFSRVQKLLSQTDPSVANMMRKYEPWLFPSLERTQYKVLGIFTGSDLLTDRFMSRTATESDYCKLTDRIVNERFWRDMAYSYASIISRYSDNGASKQAQQKPQDGNCSGEDQRSGTPNTAGNTDEGNGGRPQSIDDAIGKLLRELLAFRSPTPNMFEELDKLYSERTEEIVLDVEGEKVQAPQHELMLGSEPVDEGSFRAQSIDWSSTEITGDRGERKVHLYQGAVPFALPFVNDSHPSGLLDISLILDSSSSMGFNPEKGLGSYHHAAVGVYSLLRSVERQGIAQLLNYSLINFSEQTISSGWKTYDELREIKKLLFHYQSQGTALDPIKVRKMYETRRDNMLCVMLSDGGFNDTANSELILAEFDLMLEQGGVAPVLFQLGSATDFSRGLKKRGVLVKYISDASDFARLGINVSKEIYGRIR